MRWSFAPEFDATARAALDTGKPLVYDCPPAVWMVAPLLERLLRSPDAGRILAITPDGDLASELALHLNAARHIDPPHQDATRFLLAATGLARDAVALRRTDVASLVAAAPDALALVQRSALKAEQVTQTVLLWPERFCDTEREVVASLLSDMRGAQRLIVSHEPAAVSELIERYAPRAPTMCPIRWPDVPLPGVRVAITTATQLPTAVAGALSTLAPRAALLWDPYPLAGARWIQFAADPTVQLVTDGSPPREADVILATDLPSPDLLRAFQQHTPRVVVLARPIQEPTLATLAAPNRLLSVTREADRAHHRAQVLRADLRRLLRSADLGAELLQLAPLFDEHDPATVAAALLRTRDAQASVGYPSWVRIKLGVGKRDRLKPGDIVGVLINAAGVPKDHVGRIELADTWAFVEVRTVSAEAALRGLKATPIRGRTLTPIVLEK